MGREAVFQTDPMTGGWYPWLVNDPRLEAYTNQPPIPTDPAAER